VPLRGRQRRNVAREVVFAPEARDDLLVLLDYIAEHSNATRAQGFVGRIISYCEGFAEFPERGTRRDNLRPGLRTVGYRRRVTIAFHLSENRVVIDRILYAGRDLRKAFR
jgi:toxin ParE1/3/4